MGFVCFHALLCSSICRCVEAANGWRAYQGSGWPGTLAALSASLSQRIPRNIYIFNSAGYLAVVARVMFNDNHFAVRPELHRGKTGRQTDRLLGWLSVCQAFGNVSQSCGFLQWELTYPVNCLSVCTGECEWLFVSIWPCDELRSPSDSSSRPP